MSKSDLLKGWTDQQCVMVAIPHHKLKELRKPHRPPPCGPAGEAEPELAEALPELVYAKEQASTSGMKRSRELEFA